MTLANFETCLRFQFDIAITDMWYIINTVPCVKYSNMQWKEHLAFS